MRVRISILLMLLSAVAVAEEQKKEEKWEDASTLIYPGAPVCCIYVGLGTNESSTFSVVVSRFEKQNHFAVPPGLRMGSGSGPPQPDCRNEHVAIFANEIVVTGVMAKNHNGVRYSTDQSMRASQEREHLGLWRDAYWSTNASRITVDGHLVYAPFTGRLVMTPFDKSYSLEDFRKLAQSLTDAMRAAFPDRLVYAPIYEGSKQ